MLNNVLNVKKGFYTTKMSLKHNGIESIFQKRLTHDFHQKFKSSSESQFL